MVNLPSQSFFGTAAQISRNQPSSFTAMQQAQGRPAGNSAEREPQDREPREPKEWTSEEVGFFEPDRADTDGMSTSGRHIFYKDVYIYIDRLQDLEKVRGEEKLRMIISQTFRGSANRWYTSELTEMKKMLLRSCPLQAWYTQIIKRFNTRKQLFFEERLQEYYKQQKEQEKRTAISLTSPPTSSSPIASRSPSLRTSTATRTPQPSTFSCRRCPEQLLTSERYSMKNA